MTPTPFAIGIDLGGTNLKVAMVESGGRILSKSSRAINPASGPEPIIREMVEAVEFVLRDADLPRGEMLGVGIGSPGPLSQRTGRIIRTANLPDWGDVPLRDRLAEELRVPVILENDANAAAFGEYWMNLATDSTDLVLLTLGTGVGCGVILSGKILQGHFKNAGELGHMIVALDGLPCPCGQRGCLEQYASAGAVARRVIAAIRNGEASELASRLQSGPVIDASDVVAAARRGDALCLRVWDEACRYLAVACINIQHAYNVARIIFAGGMSEAGPFLLNSVRDHVQKQSWRLHLDIPTISLARLGNDAGVVGAASLVWANSARSPQR